MNPVQGLLLVALVVISWQTARLPRLGKHPAWAAGVVLVEQRPDLSAEPNSPEPWGSEWAFQVFEVQKSPVEQRWAL